jgi:hypothetical protein
MIPVLLVGALFTQLLPITTHQSLEDINYMNEAVVADSADMIDERLKENEKAILNDMRII